MRRWNCLFLVDALFSDSIFFDPELLLLREIFISHSKNMEIGSKDKDSIIYCPYLPCKLIFLWKQKEFPISDLLPQIY